MGDQTSIDAEGALRVQLDVDLDGQPVSGRLRTERGAEERFVGWLDFVGALERLHQLERQSPGLAGDQAGGRVMRQPQTERS